MSINNINQLVAIKLLNAVSTANSNNNASSNNKSNEFDFILKNVLGGLSKSNTSCNKCNGNNLNELQTLQSLVNSNKIGESQIVSQIAVNNDSQVNSKMDKAIDLLEKQVGKKYVWGATGPNSFDCSGLVQYIYKTALGKDIPRVSADQSKFGKAVDKKDLQVGDLVFFDTMNKGKVSHVGMYIGNNEFIHASNAKDGVKKSELSGYYEKKYTNARRP